MISLKKQGGNMKELILKVKRKMRIPLWLSSILFLVSATSSFYTILSPKGKIIPLAVRSIFYAVAAISLFFLIVGVYQLAKKRKFISWVLGVGHKWNFTGRLIDDYSFRTLIFASLSFCANAFFAITKGIAGWYSSSEWLISLSVYYLLLCILKFYLLRNSRKLHKERETYHQQELEWKSYRMSGILLIVLTIVLEGILVLIVKEGEIFTYNSNLIIAVAAYDFYSLISSIVYMLKTRKKHSPTIVSIKSINFATSLVAMLSLQTSMFAIYGAKGNDGTERSLNLLTGSVVCIGVLIMGIWMVYKSRKGLLTLYTKEENATYCEI